MGAIKSHKDLIVWQRGMDLAENCYRLTASYPPEERYGLTSQIRRASVSIPSNIAEGHNNGSSGVFLRHLAVGASVARPRPLLGGEGSKTLAPSPQLLAPSP